MGRAASAANADAAVREAERLLEEVIESYGDVKSYRKNLGTQSKGDLFELRNLAVGKPAPEIEGQDVDGCA